MKASSRRSYLVSSVCADETSCQVVPRIKYIIYHIYLLDVVIVVEVHCEVARATMQYMYGKIG